MAIVALWEVGGVYTLNWADTEGNRDTKGKGIYEYVELFYTSFYDLDMYI